MFYVLCFMFCVLWKNSMFWTCLRLLFVEHMRKISHSEDTRLPILWMGGADTTKIMPPKLRLAYMYLLHIDWKLFVFTTNSNFASLVFWGWWVVVTLQL